MTSRNKRKQSAVFSSIRTKFELLDGKPTLLRLPDVDFIDDKAGRPVGINKSVERRPILAFGSPCPMTVHLTSAD